jgi:hypothetical protein
VWCETNKITDRFSRSRVLRGKDVAESTAVQRSALPDGSLRRRRTKI